MKRKSMIIISLLLLGALSANSQVLRSYGVKAGASLAKQRIEFTPIDYRVETQNVIRPAFGVFAELFYHEYLSIQLDLLYEAKGSQTSIESVTVLHMEDDRIQVNEGPEVSSTYHYGSLSPLVRFRFDQAYQTYYALLGPRFEKMLGYSTNSEYPLDGQNNTMFGLTVGVGAEFRLGTLDAFAELQFQPDMNAVTNEDPLLVKNSLFMLSLGIRFLQ